MIMNRNFIEQIAAYVITYAPKYNIRVVSPIVAQAILESASGTSELAKNANNFFGLKYKVGRCPTASGIYHKVGSEQNPDGSHTSSAMKWCKFNNMEDCVVGYFDFICDSKYSGLKGVTDPQKYLEIIKAAGYATSLNYVTNVMNVIKRYDLTKYDPIKEDTTMTKIIALDAGHGMKTAGKQTPDGIKEWELNDKVRDKIVVMLKDYDVKFIFPDNNEGAIDEGLTNRRTMYVNEDADATVSIHHNAFKGTWCTATGVEVYVDKNATTKDIELANAIIGKLASYTGLKKRGVKRSNFTVITQNSVPAVLVEGGFMDNKKDHAVITSDAGQTAYAKAVAEALIEVVGLTKKKTSSKPATTTTATTSKKVTATGTADHRDSTLTGTYVTKANLHMRNDAGVTNKSLCVIPKGAKVRCYGYYSLSVGVKWLYVQATVGGIRYTGFCSKSYLTKQ